jgi:phage recombination protein Bet
MTDLVVRDEDNALAAYSPAQMNVLRNVLCKDANDNELMFFAQVCQSKSLDPFGQQIFLVKRKGRDGKPDSLTVQTGIDGFRAVAARSGEYAGNDEPVFKYEEGRAHPTEAQVTVWRLIQGQRVPFSATARWAEFFPGEVQGFMWKSKPHVMLGKCAEAQALRKGFPNECGGLYEKAEMERADDYQEAPASPLRAKNASDLGKRLLAEKPPTPQRDMERLKKMLLAFEELGITGDDIAAKLQLSPDGFPSEAQFEELRAWYQQLAEARKDG